MISFDVPGIDLSVHELTGGNLARLEALVELFVELFPEYAHTAPRLRRKAERPADANPLFIEHQWLVDVDQEAAAMSAFKYVPGRNLGLQIYLAVRPDYRGLGWGECGRLSRLLIAAAQEQLRVDALAAGRPTPTGLVFEVLAPQLAARYREYGMVELPVEYHEPRYSPGRATLLDPDGVEQVAFQRAQLGIFPIDGEQVDVNDLLFLTDTARALLNDHYGLPEEHWIVQRALESIQAHCTPEGEN